MRRWIIMAGGLAFFVCAGLLLENWPKMATLKNCLQSPSVPTGMLNYGSLGRALRRLRMVKPTFNDQSCFPVTDAHENNPYANIFQKKRHVTHWLYEADPGGWDGRKLQMPEPVPLPANAFHDGWPIISVTVHPDDLSDPETGIVTNFHGSGREWERPASVEYYRDRSPVFQGAAGIRLHGGKSRAPTAQHSFRLHFRNEYGREGVPMDVFFDGLTGTVYQLVVHADWPAPFTSCLAYDIARRIGCETVNTRSVLFYLNGQCQGIYFIAEHVSRQLWETRMGNSKFHFIVFKGKSDRDSDDAYRTLSDWAHDFSHPLTLEEAQQYVDVTNLSRYILSIAFNGTTDGFQGAAHLDQTQSQPRWRWINWDMDHSFWDLYPRRQTRPAWEQEGFRLAIETPADTNYRSWRKHGDLRAILFTRLMNDSPDYRSFFYRFLDDQLTRNLAPEFLQSRIDYYAGLAASYGETNGLHSVLHYTDFVKYRPSFIRREIQAYFPSETEP